MGSAVELVFYEPSGHYTWSFNLSFTRGKFGLPRPRKIQVPLYVICTGITRIQLICFGAISDSLQFLLSFPDFRKIILLSGIHFLQQTVSTTGDFSVKSQLDIYALVLPLYVVPL